MGPIVVLLVKAFGPVLAAQIASIIRGAVIAAIGAALTFLVHGMSGVDFGAWSVVATAVLSIATNIVHQLSKDPSSPKPA